MTPLRAATACGIAGLAAVVLTAWMAAHPAPVSGDRALARAIQDMTWFEPVAAAVNELGGPVSWVALAGGSAASATWAARRGEPVLPLFVSLAVAVALRPLSSILKEVVRSPRPAQADGLTIDRIRTDFGFPSGHVYTDVLVYGLLAWMVWRVDPRGPGRWAVALFGGVSLLAGPARVSAGAHWPSGCLGGYLWGLVALGCAVGAGEWLRRRRAPATPRAEPAQSAPGD